MNQPDWITLTIIGAVAGYLLPYIPKIAVFWVNRFRKDRVEGTWIVYHPTFRSNNFLIEKSTWHIRRGFFNPFSITEQRKGIVQPLARGSMRYERGFWIINLLAASYEEEVFIRLVNPIATADDIVWGLYSSLDFQGNPIVGPVLISRKELTDDEVIDFYTKRTKVSSKMRLIYT